MKKIILLLFVLVSSTFAGTGWFQDYVLINPNSSGSTYYWIGSNPSFGTQLQGTNFGVVSTLVITGADMKYWSDNQDRTGGAFYWRISEVGGSGTEVIWSQTGPVGNDYQGLWSGTIDLLSGLTPSTDYTLEIWAKSWGSSQGDNLLNNGGANYVATFTTSGAVPVELTSFTAKQTKAGVMLNWKTATEVNNFGFDVERQILNQVQNDKTKWEKIDFVEGHGNSNSPKEYSFLDNSAKGSVSYRLKQVDFNGNFEYSDIVTVKASLAKTELYQNSPNPFNPSTKISFSLAETGKVNVSIYNIIGQKVAELVNQTMESGVHNVDFNASNLPSGLYIYRMDTPNYSKTMKMMLLK